MIKKVINSGNSGAESAALGSAWLAGIETGGTIPKGYKTTIGNNSSLKLFKLTEADEEAKQSTCIKKNVDDSDATLLFIKNVKEVSKIEDFVREYCAQTMKPILVIPTDNYADTTSIDIFIKDKKVESLHITGRIDPKDKTTAYVSIHRYLNNYLSKLNIE